MWPLVRVCSSAPAGGAAGLQNIAGLVSWASTVGADGLPRSPAFHLQEQQRWASQAVRCRGLVHDGTYLTFHQFKPFKCERWSQVRVTSFLFACSFQLCWKHFDTRAVKMLCERSWWTKPMPPRWPWKRSSMFSTLTSCTVFTSNEIFWLPIAPPTPCPPRTCSCCSP